MGGNWFIIVAGWMMIKLGVLRFFGVHRFSISCGLALIVMIVVDVVSLHGDARFMLEGDVNLYSRANLTLVYPVMALIYFSMTGLLIEGYRFLVSSKD